MHTTLYTENIFLFYKTLSLCRYFQQSDSTQNIINTLLLYSVIDTDKHKDKTVPQIITCPVIHDAITCFYVFVRWEVQV